MSEPIRVPDGREVVSMDELDWEMTKYGDAYVRVPGGQTFAEATAGVPDAVKQVVDAVGVSTADATRILEQYGQAWRESLARDQEEGKP